ncbi:MAG TPA: HAMP domain-containing sensor histidine kinase [Candidatus Paceibacterota bacterium]
MRCARTNELRKLHENQHRMIADLSHNLQTPLAVLRGKLDRFERSTLHDGQTTGLTQSVDAVARFVNDLLSFACLEEKLKGSEKQLFSLTDLVRDVCEEVVVIVEAENICLIYETRPDIRLLGSEKHMREALMNLVCNAVKYMGSGTIRRIRVSLETRGDQILLAVTDTGMGISENELPRVFERFYRGSNRVYGSIPGTGLGLSIVERIVKEHGGVITVTSEVEKGSTFTLILPRAKRGRLRKHRL